MDANESAGQKIQTFAPAGKSTLHSESFSVQAFSAHRSSQSSFVNL
ncbi:hypothetical protein [Pseudomonas rhizosphaerae]|nr:hypothetical protein [Pseudomonas rhizosphaerae]MEB2870397.1 hypothetical protein [Pseudomonas rhizosphaerae]